MVRPDCKSGAWRRGRFDPCHTLVFYCDPCRLAYGWPESLFKSYGPCEECGDNSYANAVASSLVADWDTIRDSMSMPDMQRPPRRPPGRPRKEPEPS